MVDLVKIENNQVVTSSRQVAKTFGKEHKVVLRSIREILVEQNCAAKFYYQTTFTNRGKQYPEYYMTRDGFSLLVMGFTGQKALEWKVKYIQAFNDMERRLKESIPTLPNFNNPAEAARAWADQYEKRTLAEKEIKQLQPKAEFHDAVVDSDGSISIGDFAKLLRKNGLQFGRNRLFEWLREHNYLMKGGDWNSPTQQSIEQGFFEVSEYPFELNSGKKVVTTTTRITGKGQVYFMKLLKK